MYRATRIVRPRARQGKLSRRVTMAFCEARYRDDDEQEHENPRFPVAFSLPLEKPAARTDISSRNSPPPLSLSLAIVHLGQPFR